MRLFLLNGDQLSELAQLPQDLPDSGYLWVGLSREEFSLRSLELQLALQRWCGAPLVDLHVSDLLNACLLYTSDAADEL